MDLAARVAHGDADAFDDFYADHADLVIWATTTKQPNRFYCAGGRLRTNCSGATRKDHMHDSETHFEESLGRLLRASCGPETRVTPSLRERLRHQLAATPHARLQPAEFTGGALAALTCLVLLLCAARSLRAAPGCRPTSPHSR